MSTITRVSCQIKERTLREPFHTALRTVTHFDVIEFCIETNEGLVGWGEAVATPIITGDTQERILQDLQGPITELFEGHLHTSTPELAAEVEMLSILGSAKAAADLALYDLQSKAESISLPFILGSQRVMVGTDVTIPIATLFEIPDLVASRLRNGFKAFKVKLAMEPVENSVLKLELIRELVGERALLRIDPNQAWSVAHTLSFLKEIESAGISIDYLEQPTPAKEKAALAEIRRHSATPIMADESCFGMADLQELIDLNAVDLVNLKLLKCGGLTPALEMGKLAKEAGVGILVGSMMEGDRGVFAAACLASALAPDEIHDLDASWWASDSTIKYADGMVALT